MSKQSNQKIKMLKLWEILCQESDRLHQIDTATILKRLAEQGIACERKALYDDIEILNKFGYKVSVSRGRSNMYYAKNSDFTVPELSILVDAVQSATFITQKKTDELVDKIARLGGTSGDMLRNSVYFDTQKYNNEDIYRNIDLIEQAIAQNDKVSYTYFDYNAKLEEVFRKNGERYKVNPLGLAFNENNYYLVCYDDKHLSLANYRVDRMKAVKVEAERIIMADCAVEFDMAQHKRRAFSMYTGVEVNVEIEFDVSLIDVMLDKFGVEVGIRSLNDTTCRLNAFVLVSPMFFATILGLGTKARIISPDNVVEQMRRFVTEISQIYN